MDNNLARRLRVGIFLTVGLIGIVASILLLGGDKVFFKKHVHLYAQLDQVQGLTKGSIISLAGVLIGNVEAIGFLPGQKHLTVNMKIQEEFLPRLTEGSSAEIRTQGALGDKFVYIIPGDPAAPALKDGGTVETAKASDIFGIISEKGGEAVKVFDIINEVYRLTKIINAEGRSEKMMANFTEISQNLKMTTEETRKLVAELRAQTSPQINKSVEHLNSILAKVDRGEGTLGALINDSSLHERLKTMLGTESHKQSIQSLIRNSIEKSEK